MSLNIKNPETLRLVRQLADTMGVSQTAAVTTAVRKSLRDCAKDTRKAEFYAVLQEIWASQTPESIARMKAEEEGLYDEMGLPR